VTRSERATVTEEVETLSEDLVPGNGHSAPSRRNRSAYAASARGGDPRSRKSRAHEPAYSFIANDISDRIASGIYRSGDQLPTEAQLRAEFKVSPMTVRRAVGLLLDRGIVTTTQGKGTFVRGPDLGEAVFRLQDFTDMWMGDDDVDLLLLEARIAPANEEVASRLECRCGAPTVFMRRLIQRNATPLIYQIEHVFYDEHRPLVEAQLQITSLDGLLRSGCPGGIPSGRVSIQAVNLDAEAAGYLRVVEGSAALCLEHVFHDCDGRAVSWGSFLCRSDQFRLTTSIGVVSRSSGDSGA
jgi:GntR family transcriptional regulator